MKLKNQMYCGAQGKSAHYDLYLPEHFNGTLICFVHGYMGYKDWGAWNVMADYFYDRNFGFAKLNLSHNGTNVEHLSHFVDLEAFSKNCYSFEYEDMIAFRLSLDEKLNALHVNVEKHILFGHSRGGATILISAKAFKADALVSWASISDIESRFPKGEAFDDWKASGVYFRKNGRTHQDMPHEFSAYQDFMKHKTQFHLESLAKAVDCPWLILHGTADSSVDISNSKNLKSWQKNAQFIEIEHANHTFGSREPYTETQLPDVMLEACKATELFLKSI